MEITKIVITGGPCAGKTTAMSWVQNAFTQKGYRVLFVPETATELINGGVAPWTCGSSTDFQKNLLSLQLVKEKVFEAAARTMDVGGFLPSSIAVDGRGIGPADFLIAALDVLATGAGSVVVSPKEQLGDLSRFPKLRDFRPAGGWVFTPGFKDVYASDRLRWQFWTLRYIDRMQD